MPVDVTETSIRVRVRSPGEFQEGSFRTVDIDKGKGIKAVMGRLKGKTSMTVQTFIFDKEKWTVAKAEAWVKDHGHKPKDVGGFETKEFSMTIKSVNELGEFEGYASVFDVIDSDNDVIERGAFKRSIKNQKIFPLLSNHKFDRQIGFIKVKEDQHGLKVIGMPNLEIEEARDQRALAIQGQELGRPMGLSVGFRIVKWEYREQNRSNIRVIKELKLFEISITGFPANEQATIENQKSFDDLYETIEDNKDNEEFVNKIKSLLRKDPEKSTLDNENTIKLYELFNEILKEETND